MKEFKEIQSESNKVLVVNTCGWVEGLGARMQIEAVKVIKPQTIITMMKH